MTLVAIFTKDSYFCFRYIAVCRPHQYRAISLTMTNTRRLLVDIVIDVIIIIVIIVVIIKIVITVR